MPFTRHQAPKGPPGPQGEAGTGLTGRGGWVSGETYEPNDFVFDRSSDDPDVNSMWIVQAGEPFVSTVQPWEDPVNWVEFQAPAGEPGMLPDGTAAGNTPFWDGSQWVVTSNNLFNDGNNIGIGTAEPSQKLDVDGDIRLRGHIWDSGNLPGGSGQVLVRGDEGIIWQDMPDSGITGSGTAGNIAYWSGVSSLGSLPYILYGDDESVKIASKEDADDDDPIFEVKNRDGNVVFGVYQTGVRIYVEDDITKGPRAGFAVGGFTRHKGDEEEIEYLRVDPGRVRITIDDSLEEKDDDTKGPRAGFAVGGFTRSKQEEFDYFSLSASSAEFLLDETGLNKGPRAGFAVGGFTKSKDGVQDYFNISGTETPDVIDSEARILWYPQKEAFLAGRVLVESPDSVGTNSWASGFESKSAGSWSQALGYRAIARGDYSTAIGREAVASSDNSFALGQFARASNDESYAFGRGAVAQGLRSYAFGSFGIDSAGIQTGITHAKGDYSTAIGQGSVSEGLGSVTLGLGNLSEGNYSTALGYMNSSIGFGSTSIGYEAAANGNFAVAIGYKAESLNRHSIAIGERAKASGGIAIGDRALSSSNGTALGQEAEATADFSVAVGTSFAYGTGSNAVGLLNTAVGHFSSALGSNTTAQSFSSTVVGRFNIVSGNSESWVNTDPIFVIGNGWSQDNRSNAMTVLKNGNVGIGTISPAALLHVNGTMRVSTTRYSGSNIELNQDGTGNRFAYIDFHGDDEYTDYALRLIRYNSGADADSRLHHRGEGQLQLYAQEAADIVFHTDGAQRMKIQSNGMVGIGVQTPVYRLELPNSSNEWGQARANEWLTYSDGRVKSQRHTLKYGLADVLKLQPVSYLSHSSEITGNRIEIHQEGVMNIGLIAQEVYKIIPEVVKRPENEASDLWSMSYEKLVPVLVRAIQEQQVIIRQQNETFRDQQLAIESLEQKIEAASDQNGKLTTTLNELDELKSEIEMLKTMIMMLSNVE